MSAAEASADAAVPAAGAVPNPWRVLLVALSAQFGISVVDQGIPTLAGFLKSDLRLSAATVGLAVSAFPFGKILGSYVAGRSADRLGERPVLLAGGVVTALSVAIASALPVAGVFVLLVFAGVSASAATPAGGRLVLNAFPRRRRGLALSVRQTAVPVGGVVAAALLPWIAAAGGWRLALAATAIVTLAALAPLARSHVGARTDAAEPAPGMSPSARRTLSLLTLWGCLLVTGQFAMLAFLALDLHQRAGLALTTGSMMLAIASGFGAAGRIAWGILSDRLLRLGRKPFLLALNVTALVASLMLLATPGSASLLELASIAAFAGFMLIGFQGLWVTMVAETAGPARVGAETGLAITFVTMAITASPPLFGLVADIAGSYRAVWAALSVVLAVALVPALLVVEPRSDDI